jgi:hypothetical protein
MANSQFGASVLVFFEITHERLSFFGSAPLPLLLNPWATAAQPFSLLSRRRAKNESIRATL